MVRKHAAYLRALASVLIAVLRRALWILPRVGFLLASRHFGRGVLLSSAAQGVSSFHVLGQPRTAPFSCTPRPSAAHCAHYRPPAMLAVRIPKEPLQSDSASRVWTLSSHERESGCHCGRKWSRQQIWLQHSGSLGTWWICEQFVQTLARTLASCALAGVAPVTFDVETRDQSLACAPLFCMGWLALSG